MLFYFVLLFYSSINAGYQKDRLKGIIELEKGNYINAEKIFRSLSDKDDTYLLLGITQNKKGEHQQAIKYLRQFAAKNQNNKVFHFYLAESLYKTGSIDEALEEFRKSELLNERIEESVFYSGTIYLDKGDNERAFSFFIKVIDQKGDFKDLAHYYAGVTIYRKAQYDYSLLKDALYHFDKVNYYNSVIYEEAKKYINVINEYVEGGVTRYKRRWNLTAKADLSYTKNRIISPFKHAPGLALNTDKNTAQGSLAFDSSFAPIIDKDYSLYLLYDFKTDLAFNTAVLNTNYQFHNIGLGTTYQSKIRNWELGLKYFFQYNRIYEDTFKKLLNAHCFELSYETSLFSNMSIKASIPIAIIDGNNTNYGSFDDFSGKAYSFILGFYSYLKNGVSFKASPFISFFNTNIEEINTKTYGLEFKTKLPWDFLFFQPAFEFSPEYISSNSETRLAMKYGAEFFVPFGIGMSGIIFVNLERNFIKDVSNLSSGFGFEYTY